MITKLRDEKVLASRVASKTQQTRNTTEKDNTMAGFACAPLLNKNQMENIYFSLENSHSETIRKDRKDPNIPKIPSNPFFIMKTLPWRFMVIEI